jgi:hypothetical protein
MKLVRFSNSYNSGGYDFDPHLQQSDGWVTSRPPVVTQVAGAGGVFDFFDSDPFPVTPLIVEVSFTVEAATYELVEGELDDVRDNTIAADRSRLWFLPRDGSLATLNDLRWMWAKCISGPGTPEQFDAGNYVTAPVELRFHAPEGIWYGALINYDVTQASPQNFNVTNNGNYPALADFNVTPSGGTVTSFTMTNNTNAATWTFGANVSAATTLNVHAKNYNVLNNGVDAYSDLTVGNNQVAWMWLNPGVNSMTATYSGASARVILFEVNDAYLY